MLSTTSILSASLTISGLAFSFTKDGNTSKVSYDPHATADLLQQVGLIEGFDTEDRTGEPVILYTDNRYGRPVPGYALWCDFVKGFPLCERHIQIVLEYREHRKQYNRAIGKINYLLHPAKKAA